MQPPVVGGPPHYVSSQPPPLPPGSVMGGVPGPAARGVSRVDSDAGSRRSFEAQASTPYAPREPMMKTSPRSSEARALPGGAHWGGGPPQSNGPPPPRRPSMERFQYSPQNASRPLPPYIDRQPPPPPPHMYGDRSADRPPFDDRYPYGTDHPSRGPPFVNYASRGPPPPAGQSVWQDGPYPPRFADAPPPKGMSRGREDAFPQAKRVRYD